MTPKNPEQGWPPEEPTQHSDQATSETREEKALREQYQHSVETLQMKFDITDLTAIEATHLKRIVKDVLHQHGQIIEQYKKGRISNRAFFNTIPGEAVARWLYELYGIRPGNVHQNYAIKDITTGEVFQFRERYSEEAGDKRHELMGEGHIIGDKWVVTGSFKEYLRRVRERARELPEPNERN